MFNFINSELDESFMKEIMVTAINSICIITLLRIPNSILNENLNTIGEY